ncbi:MAG: hypothetical protein ACPMAG_09470 [Limisphaerales bacterium]|jgi:hypothetical protein
MRYETKKRFLLRIEHSLWNDICLWADEDSRSVNNQIEHILKTAVQKWKQKGLRGELGQLDSSQTGTEQAERLEAAVQRKERVDSNKTLEESPAQKPQTIPQNSEQVSKQENKDFWISYDGIPD